MSAKLTIFSCREPPCEKQRGQTRCVICKHKNPARPVTRCVCYSAKSLQGEAPCGSAVYGNWTEMSPAPLPPARPPSPHWTPLPLPDSPPPPLDLPPDSMTGGRQGGQGRIDEQGRIDDITDASRDFALQLP